MLIRIKNAVLPEIGGNLRQDKKLNLNMQHTSIDFKLWKKSRQNQK